MPEPGPRAPYSDDRRWPVLVINGPPAVTPAAVDEHNDAIRRCLARREPFVVVSDARAARETGARERKATADFERRHFDELRRDMKALALVFSSPPMAGPATPVSWPSTPPYPKKCFLDVGEVEARARSKPEPPPR